MSQYISVACAIAAFLAGWMVNGWRLDANYQEKEASILRAVKQKEERYMTEIESLQNAMIEEQNESKKRIDKLRTDVSSGRVRLSIPVRECSNSTTKSAETRAEIDGQTSNDLISIAEDGDSAIRELNMCIDSYNALRK